jgi:hypothetical protein
MICSPFLRGSLSCNAGLARRAATPEERGELLKLLRDTITAARLPLSQRIRNLKSALAKLRWRSPGSTA